MQPGVGRHGTDTCSREGDVREDLSPEGWRDAARSQVMLVGTQRWERQGGYSREFAGNDQPAL